MIYDSRFAGRSGVCRCVLKGRRSAGGLRRLPHGASWLVLAVCVVPFSGCGKPQAQVPPLARPSAAQAGGDIETPAPVVADSFAPVRINILPLTEFSGVSEGGLNTLTVYVALLDAFGSPLKSPGTLRFELYEYVPRSAASKGQRTAIWPDVDLTGPVENNQRWRDFLRAYEFELDVRADRSKTYVLEATCLCPDGKRLTGEYRLRSPGNDKPQNGT
jgi:hypothetical protein